MQCFQCQFENLPGLVRCGRCDAVLSLDSTVVHIFPPRAAERNWLSRLRYFLVTCHRSPVELSYQANLREAKSRSSMFYPLLVSGGVPTKVFRALIPGLVQAALGRRTWGISLLGFWLLAFAAGTIVTDPFWWWQVFGMSTAVRMAASIDLAFRSSSETCGCFGWGALQGLMSFVAVDCVLWMLLLQITS